jgi:hypothetical protein
MSGKFPHGGLLGVNCVISMLRDFCQLAIGTLRSARRACVYPEQRLE